MKNLQLNPENGLVFDPQTGSRYRVNDTGAALLLGWQRGTGTDTLIDSLCEAHDLPRNQAERLVHSFHRQCRASGLKVPDLPSPAPAVSASLNPSAA